MLGFLWGLLLGSTTEETKTEYKQKKVYKTKIENEFLSNFENYNCSFCGHEKATATRQLLIRSREYQEDSFLDGCYLNGIGVICNECGYVHIFSRHNLKEYIENQQDKQKKKSKKK
jgi:hypothetical protein